MNYLKQSNPENCWILDIETDSLTPTKIWVVCLKNLRTEEEKEFYDAESFNQWYKAGSSEGVLRVLLGHNITSFDVPVLIRLWASDIDLNSLVDTLVLSYLYNPALEGGHSLEAWGHRLNSPKGIFSDWSHLSDEMVSYCKQDVNLTRRLYLALTEKMLRLGYSELSAEIEHRIALVIRQQTENGFWFDKVRGLDLLQQLRRKQSGLTEDIQRLFPPVGKLSKAGTFKRNKDGGLPAFIEKARHRYDRVVLNDAEGTYEFYSLEPFNIGSPQQRVSRLLEMAWEPQKWTKKGFPQVDEDALVLFAEKSGKKEIAAIAEWLVLQGRSSMIEGWITHCGEDSRIHGRVNSCGATSRRCTHSSPNTANIPSGAKAKYGHECRALWAIEPNKGLCLVGVDAAGLETVGLLHYLPDKYRAQAAEILNQPKPNDVHSMNARKLTQVLGREIDREWGSKTSFYATIYGAYPPKLATIVKGPVSDGEIVQDVLFNSVPGLKNVIEESQYEWRTQSGRLRCIDGGYVVCPTQSAALNYRIQPLGAVVMKLACILLYEEAKKQQLWFRQVGFIHDELQMETKLEDGERLGKLSVQCISEAANQLKFKVPLTGSYSVGQSWDETH